MKHSQLLLFYMEIKLEPEPPSDKIGRNLLK
jgi:hypothetical protein